MGIRSSSSFFRSTPILLSLYPPSHPYLATNYPRHYDLRLTSEQEGARVRNLYAFRERMEGGEDDDDEDDDDDDLVDSDGDEDVKGKAKADDRNKKSRREFMRANLSFLDHPLCMLIADPIFFPGVVSMVGMITNEAALKPQITGPGGLVSRGGKELGISPEYREVLRKRKLEASKPRHSVKVLDDDDASRNNMLTSGVGAGFIKGPRASLIVGSDVVMWLLLWFLTLRFSLLLPSTRMCVGALQTQNRKTGNQAEKFARMPRNELMDLLFESFEEYPYWSIKGLRARVEQPEVYLRDVLSSIADLHKRGPYSGNWSLKPEYAALRKDADRRESDKRGAEEASRRQQQMGAQDPGSRSNVVSSSGSSRQEIKLEEGEDIGGDDEDDMDDVA